MAKQRTVYSIGRHNVVCVACKRVFEGFHAGQAYGCASTVNEQEIIGHYGSYVADLKVLRAVEGVDLGLPDGDICDDCISKLLEEGKIVVTNENYFV